MHRHSRLELGVPRGGEVRLPTKTFASTLILKIFKIAADARCVRAESSANALKGVGTLTDYGDILRFENLKRNFPWDIHPEMRPNQEEALRLIARHGESLLLEAPTGSGKSAIGYTVLKTLAEAGKQRLFYITPSKVNVDQLAKLFPDLTVQYGRHEYDCLYYEDLGDTTPYKADEIPCLSLHKCGHRLNIRTGEQVDPGLTPCPYYAARFQTKQAEIVVCTAAFYLYTHLFSKQFEPPDALVIDEVHQLAKVVRSALSYEITDWHLARSSQLLDKVGATEEAKQLDRFRKTMIKIMVRKPSNLPTLLSDNEIIALMEVLDGIDADRLRQHIVRGIKSGQIDPVEDRETLKRLENITYDLSRYLHSFEYAMEDEWRNALNYVTYAYSEKEPVPPAKVQYKLVIKNYYVEALIRKRMLAPYTLSLSATIGDPKVFGYETGIKHQFYSLPGTFPAENALVCMPTDTADLTFRQRSRQDVTKTLRKIAKQCFRIASNGHRSLVVVVSNKEREKFQMLCEEEGVDVVTYGEDETAKQAFQRFKTGEGDVLVGTAANFGEGIDLPDEIAPFTFFLRPAYPSPHDPAAQFEQRRYKGRYWALQQWNAMIGALQVRGRNIRSSQDRGITIFVSQQFRDFVRGSLPEYLDPSYRGKWTLEQCVDEGLQLLK